MVFKGNYPLLPPDFGMRLQSFRRAVTPFSKTQEAGKLSRSLFRSERLLRSDQLLGNHQKSPSVPQAVCVMSQMLVSLLSLIVLLRCHVLPLPHSSALQVAEARQIVPGFLLSQRGHPLLWYRPAL